ncbi:PAS domain S-box protein [Paenibacillus sp. GD4]|uniref:PAS domain-containing sensor histidine kinase n=1 Tax=Paenibacillus sp. GD4 TaxID=3068890 RepID=UPI002796931C|nr:PAS domain-containing sensor histidine kinase [Paenibacillus sp. GD4]MDQ1912799.1 PAS domain S-box protein [Paenibacillus sp. GD4]
MNGLIHKIYDFLNQLGDATMITDVHAVVIKVNPAFTRLYGWEEHEIIGRRMPMVPERHWADTELVHQSLLTNGQFNEYETVMQDKRGTLFPVSVNLSVLRDPQGKISGFICITKDLSERARIPRDLELTRDDLCLMTEHMTDSILVLDLRGNFTYISPALSRAMGVSSDQSIHVKEIVDPDEYGQVMECYENILRDNKPHSTEIRMKHGEDWLVYDAKGSPILEATGEIKSVIFICRDITDRKKAELALQEAEEKYRSLVEEALVGVYMYQDERFVYINPRLAEMFGYSVAEMNRIHPLSLFAEKYRPLLREQLNNISAKRTKDLNLQAEGVKRDGSAIFFEMSGKGTLYNGKPAAIGTVLDISERRRAENAIRESDRRYRKLLDLSPEPILVHSGGIIVYVNEACLRLLQANQRSDLIGTHLFQFLQDEDTHKAMQRLETALSLKSTPGYMEYRLVSLDGQEREVESSSTMIDVVLGIPVIQTVLRDITERKKTEELIRRSDKLSALGQMAAGIAHEIRNPLTSLKGFVQLLRSQSSGHPEYYEIMLSELDRINEIVTEFMKIAKPQTAHFEKKNLVETLEHIVALMNSQAILHNTEIIMYSEGTVPLIYCDENQLKQVFINILKNAIEAMPRGGTITVFIRPISEGEIDIQITDQGGGIPESFLAKLGDPFFTTKESGTGLGLMVCYQIIEAHHGHIDISSELGQGTTVRIRLPIQ